MIRIEIEPPEFGTGNWRAWTYRDGEEDWFMYIFYPKAEFEEFMADLAIVIKL